jgi:hypothetical protein
MSYQNTANMIIESLYKKENHQHARNFTKPQKKKY